jgi:erythromycin esterase-like protein
MTVKPVLYSLLFLAFSNIVNAQQLQEVISKPLEQVMPTFDKTFATGKMNDAKLVGLGDVGILAKETKKVNAYLASYLISKKGFRNIVLKVDDWTLRPLNALLKSPSVLKPGELDSVIKAIFRTDFQFRNAEFKSLLEWIKNYNVAHPKDLINIYGAGSEGKIPPSYLLTAYMYRAAPLEARKLSAKWSEETVSDSLAYTEIATWIKTQRLSKLTLSTKQIVDSCENDLLHNNSVITITSFGQKIPLDKWERRTTYIANQILSNQSKKSIFYALNSEVGRSFAMSPLLGDDKIQSVGKLLGDNLKEKYYVIVTDFINKANLALINPATGNYKIVTFEGSEQVRKLNEQKYYFEIGSEKNSIPNYLPAIIDAFEGMQPKLITIERTRIADGIMLLSDISGVDFSY